MKHKMHPKMSEKIRAYKARCAERSLLKLLVRQPRHKWFSAPDKRCDDGWYGPHETIEAAVIECASNYGTDHPIFVAQGYKLTKADREEWGVEFDWQCESQNAIEVRLPNSRTTERKTMSDPNFIEQPEARPVVACSDMVRDSEPRYSKREISLAVMKCCTCGGGGPDDENTCPACHVYHTLATVPNDQAQRSAPTADADRKENDGKH